MSSQCETPAKLGELFPGQKRVMPQQFGRFLIKLQGGKRYLPAAYRLLWFRDECPDWGISTSLIEGGHEAGFATVQATIFNPDGRVIAMGLKTETMKDFPAGWVEKAETGAIARALACLGFGTQVSGDYDEAGEARRPADSGAAAPSGKVGGGKAVWDGPGLCPRCHAPEGKLHGRPCA